MVELLFSPVGLSTILEKLSSRRSWSRFIMIWYDDALSAASSTSDCLIRLESNSWLLEAACFNRAGAAILGTLSSWLWTAVAEYRRVTDFRLLLLPCMPPSFMLQTKTEVGQMDGRNLHSGSN